MSTPNVVLNRERLSEDQKIGKEGKGVGGQKGEMAQTMYTHMNK
jgi:hypothetical protein